MVELDGASGEGGGQVLRSALTLSLVTGEPVRIVNLRARRSPSGLRPQHLACVRGAEALGQGHSEGAQVGASEITFFPGKVGPGDHLLDVGTAGSVPLLLQCLFYPLALAGGGVLTLRGGTHLPHSPIYPYLSWIWQPMVEAYGFRLQLSLKRAGFYPEGGGEIRAELAPMAEPPSRVDLHTRGNLLEAVVTSQVAQLSFDVADRQGRAALQALRERGVAAQLEKLPLPASRSAGGAVFIRAQFERSAAGFTGLTERNTRPEDAGRDAALAFARFLESGGALDEHLSDQILLPAALLAAGRLGESSPAMTRFSAERITDHLKTHAEVIEAFLPVKVIVSAETGTEVLVVPAPTGKGVATGQ